MKSFYTGGEKPVARPRNAPVEVFLAGHSPGRPYIVVGQVQASTRSQYTRLYDMLEHAARDARKLGGDAIVDVWPQWVGRKGASVNPSRGPRILTANIAKWR